MPNAGITADSADFDGDGVSNLIEYALGSDPTLTNGADGPASLPTALVGDSISGLLSDRLSLSFNLDNPNPSDVTYVIEASDDLGTWTTVASKTGTASWTWLGGGTSRIVISGTSPVSVKIGDIVPADAANPKRMMRLKVSNP